MAFKKTADVAAAAAAAAAAADLAFEVVTMEVAFVMLCQRLLTAMTHHTEQTMPGERQ